MSPQNDRLSADQLRDNHEAIWTRVEKDVVPKVLVALRRLFPTEQDWLDLEGVIRSAERTAWRRLQEHADPKLEALQTFDSFLRWLIGTARNKFLAQLRRVQVEKKHASRLAKAVDENDEDVLRTLAAETAGQVVQQVETTLANRKEGIIVEGKLAGKSKDAVILAGKLAEKVEIQIANEVGQSQRWVRSRWQKIVDELRKAVDDANS
jgi:DNA-directed RNA polymerase specialized sigma24 family protein